MDRDNFNQSQPSAEFDDSEEGTNYLRRLKGKSIAESPGQPTDGRATMDAAPETPQAETVPGMNLVFTERRKTQRYVCSGRIVMSAEGTNYRMWGTLTDISLHGCYVEINNTFPVGTKLNLQIDANGVQVKMEGFVRATYPFLGMGVSFGQVEPKELAQLQQLIKALAGRRSVHGASAT